MERLKVIFRSDPLMDGCPAQETAVGGGSRAMFGGHCQLVDADTGDPLGCVQDFSVNVPMEGAITVDARLLVAEIELRPSGDAAGE